MPTRSFSPFPVGSPEYLVEYIGYRTVAVAITLVALEGVLTGLRFLSRYAGKTPYGRDDAFIIPSLIFAWGTCILAIVMVKIGGVGRHESALAQLNPVAIENWAKSLIAVECIYCTAVTFPKLSILSFYLRIFTTKRYRIAAYTLAGIITANGAAGVITSLVSCVPLEGRWNPSLPGAKCIKIDPFWRWISFANILTDVIMLGLPLPVIWGLNTSKNQKVGLTLIFLTGSFGLISSVVRFAIFFDTEGFVDGTWTSATLMIWTAIEPGVYHLAACLPTLRPLFLLLTKKISSTVKTRTTHLYGDHSSLNAKDIQLLGREGADTKSARGGFVRLGNSGDATNDSYGDHSITVTKGFDVSSS